MRRDLVLLCCLALALALAGPTGTASAAPGSTPGATASAAGAFTPVLPARLADTRSGKGARTPGANTTVRVRVAGVAGVPASGVSAVALTVTAVTPAAAGHVTVFAGSSLPATSNISFGKGVTTAGEVVTRVGSDGTVALHNGSGGATNLLVDVSGWYASGTPSEAGTFVAVTPTRAADTRVAGSASTPPAHGTTTLSVTGTGPVPATGVGEVMLTLTAVTPAAGGYLTAYPGGAARPATSDLNLTRGITMSNTVVVPVGTGGRVTIYNSTSAPVALVVDVAGYFLAGTPRIDGAYRSFTALRLADTRTGLGGETPAANSALRVAVDNRIPTGDIAALQLNVTAVAPARGGHVTAYGGNDVLPPTSGLAFIAGRTQAAAAITPDGADGEVTLYNASSTRTDLLADVAGYYLGAPPTRTGAISGRVTASDGTGLGHVVVVVRTDPYKLITMTATTDGTGAYRIDDVPISAAGYPVCFQAEAAAGGPSTSGYDNQCRLNRPWNGDPDNEPGGAQPVTVSTGAVHTGIDAVLLASSAIGGTVTGGGGPLAGVEVYAIPQFANGSYSSAFSGVTSDATGRFRFTQLTPGTGYAICFDARSAHGGTAAYGYLDECFRDRLWPDARQPSIVVPDGVQPVVAQSRTLVRVDTDLAPGGAITGTVTGGSQGAALGHMDVQAVNTDTSRVYYSTTDANGAYTVRTLPAGTYRVCFDANRATGGSDTEGYVSSCLGASTWVRDEPATGTTVSLTDGSATSAVDVRLAAGGSVSGTMTAGDTGRPLYGVRVEAFDSSGTLLGFDYSGLDVDNGTYRIAGLPSTDSGYTICFDADNVRPVHASSCYADQPWHDSLPPPAAGTTPVTVQVAQDHPGIDATIDTGGLIEGTVTAGSPATGLAHATVSVYSATAQLVAQVSTSSDGSWFLRVATSTVGYTVCFTAPNGSRYAAQCFSGQAWDGNPQQLPGGAQPVPVSADSDRQGLDATLT